MSAVDLEILGTLVDREFEFILSQSAQRRRLLLPRLLAFVGSDPRLVGLIEDIQLDEHRLAEQYHYDDQAVRKRLRELWATHGQRIASALEPSEDAQQDLHMRDPYCSLNKYEEKLVEISAVPSSIELSPRAVIRLS